MAVTIVGSMTAGDDTDENHVTPLVTPHVSTMSGDFMLALVAIRSPRTSVRSVPPGWTPHTSFNGLIAGNSVRCWLYFKTAGEGEPATQWTFNAPTRSSLTIVTYRGVNPADPFDTELTSDVTEDGSEQSITIPGVETLSDGALLVAFHARGGSSERSPVIQEDGIMVLSSTEIGTLAETWYEQRTRAGATGSRTFTDPDSEIRWVGGMVALRPIGAGKSDPIPTPVITSITAESSSSLRIVWEDGEPR